MPKTQTPAEKIQRLWAEQCADWPMLERGAENLAKTQTREVVGDGVIYRLQRNPGRVVSVGAKVDARFIAQRPCFLCPHMRPSEQHHVVFGDRWLFLCNPMPICAPHFTIAPREHVPQRFEACLPAMLEMADVMPDAFTILYNGPGCGASAPDHLHLQAIKLGTTPLEQRLLADWPELRGLGAEWRGFDAARVAVVDTGLGAVVLAQADRAAAMLPVVRSLVHGLADAVPSDPEPMLNAFAFRAGGSAVAGLIARRAHRPSVYGFEEGQRLISPGVIDMMGLTIVPKRDDFETLDAESLAHIYRDVAASPSLVRQFVTRTLGE